MTAALPEDMHQEARPPVATHVAPPSGEAGRRSMAIRPWVRPILVDGPVPFGAPDRAATVDVRHPYVRRYWTAVIGPSAVADLLRLVQAARLGTNIRQPLGLSALLAERLVAAGLGASLVVASDVRPLDERQLRYLPPALRAEAVSYRLS